MFIILETRNSILKFNPKKSLDRKTWQINLCFVHKAVSKFHSPIPKPLSQGLLCYFGTNRRQSP